LGWEEIGVPKWRSFYHIVWATKGRAPLIGSANEVVVRVSIRTTCSSEKAILHALGKMPDHVHVAVSVPPSVSRARFVGHLKGSSAHAVNASVSAANGERAFAWQAEYGVFSFTERNLPDVIAYVTYQRQRHAARDTWSSFEDFASD
jgi:putative transposase